MMWPKLSRIFLPSLFLLCLLQNEISAADLIDVTGNLFSSPATGVVAAFGDFNADKLTDIFVIKEDGHSVVVYLASSDSKTAYSERPLVEDDKSSEKIITSVMPGDFNGDAFLDILITRQKKDALADPVTAHVYWGGAAVMSTGMLETNLTKENITVELQDQPLILDANADMLPDLFAVTASGERFYWIASKSKIFTPEPMNTVNITASMLGKLRLPHSNAFLDLNGDLAADLYITNTTGYEIWLNKDGVLTYSHTLPLPDSTAKIIGQTSFVDIDGDSRIDHIVPVCIDELCKTSMVYIYANLKWSVMLGKMVLDGKSWGFVPPSLSPHKGINIPIDLRMGDYNMDGYPDALTTLYREEDGKTIYKTVLLENVPCADSKICQTGRTFSIQWDTPLAPVAGPLLATFYDIQENGILDIIIVHMGDKPENTPQIRAYENAFTADAYFLKVMVLSGLCFSNCPGGRNPYGVNQPGATVQFKSTRPNGNSQNSTASQLYQSSHYSLKLPYTVFGLGQTPNFVDRLVVGIPHPPLENPRHHEWSSIIPNSQIVVLPDPPNRPDKWKYKLFVTPSRLVLITAAALIGTCGFVAGLVGILHWIEKREDKKEKRQDAHRFHFDAM